MDRPIVTVSLVLLVGATTAAAQVQFTDQTLGMGVQFVHAAPVGDPLRLGAGGAFGDFNGDGLLDLYLCQRTGPNALFENRGPGTPFKEVAAFLGVADTGGEGTGALFGDYDNDGDQDLYVLNRGANVLFRNDGPGGASGWTFTDVTALAGVQAFGRSATACFGDYDADGYLDLYVANHSYAARLPAPGDPFHSDRLFHNVPGPGGTRRFEDVSATLQAVADLDHAIAHSAGFFDYDDDGDLDLYVVNEEMTVHDPALLGNNFLFQNEGPDGAGGWTFTEVGAAAGLDLTRHPMGLAIGDYNNDGLFDLALSDFGPNHLFLNQGGTFTDEASSAGVDRPVVPGTGVTQVGWGLVFLDADLDGFEDLYVATGGLTSLTGQPNPLFQNDGNPPRCTFTDVTSTSGCNDERSARTVLKGDYDNDGDLDLCIVNLDGPARLFRNDQVGGDHLVLELVGRLSNRSGIGAHVTVSRRGHVDQHQLAQSGSTTGGSHDPRLFFGVSGSNQVDSVVVDWPSGERTTLANVAVNQVLVVREPCPASWKNYGSGVAGTLGVPTLTASAPPVLGTTISIVVGNSAGHVTPGILFIGIYPDALPTSWGTLYVQPLFALLVTLPTSGLNLTGTVGTKPGLCGQRVFMQTVEFDAAAPAGFSATPGLELLLGF